MSEHPDRPGIYNPLEDTGDWPFRDSAPPPPTADPADAADPVETVEAGAASEAVLDADPEAAEPEPEPISEAPPPITEAEPEPDEPVESEPEVEVEPEVEPEPDLEPVRQHAAGELLIPDGPDLIQGGPNGFRRTVAVVVSRFNAEITNRLLESAVDALAEAHVARESITVVPVPGAFELPLAAMALAKTRHFSCIVALGCVIRGETPHFDYVAGEAASGLQLAAIETGVPVSFGLLTCETREQAEARVGRGADAARAALEMADLFTQVRTRATRSG